MQKKDFNKEARAQLRLDLKCANALHNALVGVFGDGKDSLNLPFLYKVFIAVFSFFLVPTMLSGDGKSSITVSDRSFYWRDEEGKVHCCVLKKDVPEAVKLRDGAKLLYMFAREEAVAFVRSEGGRRYFPKQVSFCYLFFFFFRSFLKLN